MDHQFRAGWRAAALQSSMFCTASSLNAPRTMTGFRLGAYSDITARRTDARFSTMMLDVRRKKFDAVVSWKLDRLGHTYGISSRCSMNSGDRCRLHHVR